MRMNWSTILEHVASVKVNSITDSLFKFSLFFVVFGIIAAALKTHNWIIIFLFSCVGIILFLAIFFFCYFSMKNPDYLRSESFHLKKKSIEILGDKENHGNLNTTEIKFITSPYAPNSNNDNKLLEK